MNFISNNFFLIILAIILWQIDIITLCKKTKEPAAKQNQPQSSNEHFQFKRYEPGNDLGIIPTVMAFIEREAKETSEIWRINKAFTTEETWTGFLERCDADKDKKPGSQKGLIWKDCVINNDGISFTLNYGVPEPKNKTISYLAIDFEPFKRKSKDGRDIVCKLNEVLDNKVYIVLNTWSEFPKNDTFPRSVVDSVAVPHQHQLDRFGPAVLDFFKDLIGNEGHLYNFDKEDYLTRDSPYECFLAIASSASKSVIEEKCSMGCYYFKEISESDPEYEKYLDMANDQEQEAQSEDNDNYHEEL